RLAVPLLLLLGPNEQEIEDGEDRREEQELRHHGAGTTAVGRLAHRVGKIHHEAQTSGSSALSVGSPTDSTPYRARNRARNASNEPSAIARRRLAITFK